MKRSLRVDGVSILYELSLASTNRLSISVYPDLSVRVRAPLGTAAEMLERRLHKRVPWILHQLRYFERYHPLPAQRRYVSGETHLYLGRQYRLRVRGGPEAVRLSRPFLLVTHPRQTSTRVVEQLVRTWYLARARAVFPRRLVRVLGRAPWLARSEPRLRIREMATRWGSCGASGVISLSTELVKTPLACIDYVVAHELCHQRELNHSKRFYQLLARAMPDWERARDRLNRSVR